MSDEQRPWASKWCPMVRDGGDANNTRAWIAERNPEWSRCIGQECMMFRHHEFKDEIGMKWESFYCGLAGRP